ncbi:MAG: patatin-like phospholipase family protein [Bacteroidota bacterium]
MSQKVSLVLSSGGCRGLAHIGVIEELLKDGYEISSISGSSIGSLVGGIYCSGNLERFKEWVCQLDELDIFDLMDFTFTGQGFIKAERFFRSFEVFIGCKTFEELKIPLAVVATDLTHRTEVVFDKGSLLLAIRASVAIPSVVTPVLYKDMILVDGGVINPIPSDCVKRSEGDLLVVVDVSANISYEKPHFNLSMLPRKQFSVKRKLFEYAKNNFNLFSGEKSETVGKPGYLSVIDKTIDIMQDRISRLTIVQEKPEIKVELSRHAASTFEFYKAQELIEAGKIAYHKAKEHILQNNY